MKMTETQGLPNELYGLLEAQRTAFANDIYPSAVTRRQRLQRLLQLIQENKNELCAALNQDYRCHPLDEVMMAEIFPSVDAVRDSISHVRQWMKPRKAKTSLWFKPARSRIIPQPLGVVGIMVPWNYPFKLLFSPLAGALAAGNRVLIKPSEYGPQVSALLQRLFSQYFAADEIAVVTGDADVARQFSMLPFDHLLFTGSTNVGKHVMRAAADHLTPVTLELGGKSPVIFGPDVNLKLATERLLTTKLIKSGQTCVSPDYLLLPLGQEEAFIAQAKRVAQARYPQWPNGFSSIANERQMQRLREVLRDAEAKGAHVVKLFDADDSEIYLVPRLFFNCTDDMRILQEEIFGPFLPVMAYRALVDTIAYINARARPLALYYFGDHAQDIEQITLGTISGGVCVNDCLVQVSQDSLPFGGVGASGMGHYHGIWGFNTFSKLKSVFYQARFNGVPLLYPPFTTFSKLLLKLMIR